MTHAGAGAPVTGGLPPAFKRQPALPPLGLRNSLTSIAEAGTQLTASLSIITAVRRVAYFSQSCVSCNATSNTAERLPHDRAAGPEGPGRSTALAADAAASLALLRPPPRRRSSSPLDAEVPQVMFLPRCCGPGVALFTCLRPWLRAVVMALMSFTEAEQVHVGEGSKLEALVKLNMNEVQLL